MKKIVLAAAAGVFFLSACGKNEQKPEATAASTTSVEVSASATDKAAIDALGQDVQKLADALHRRKLHTDSELPWRKSPLGGSRTRRNAAVDDRARAGQCLGLHAGSSKQMPRNTLVINCDFRETRVALIEEGIRRIAKGLGNA